MPRTRGDPRPDDRGAARIEDESLVGLGIARIVEAAIAIGSVSASRFGTAERLVPGFGVHMTGSKMPRLTRHGLGEEAAAWLSRGSACGPWPSHLSRRSATGQSADRRSPLRRTRLLWAISHFEPGLAAQQPEGQQEEGNAASGAEQEQPLPEKVVTRITSFRRGPPARERYGLQPRFLHPMRYAARLFYVHFDMIAGDIEASIFLK